MRERGLKFFQTSEQGCPPRVAPRAGAWIEITAMSQKSGHGKVALRIEAWIEISNALVVVPRPIVAPRAGAWIEISRKAGVNPGK